MRSTQQPVPTGTAQARLFVHDQSQPTLVVNDLKSGANGKGAIALWLDIGTEARPQSPGDARAVATAVTRFRAVPYLEAV